MADYHKGFTAQAKKTKMGCRAFCQVFNKERCSDEPQGKRKDSKSRTPLKQRLSYCTGHIFNDLCSAVWFTYFIVYFNKVVGLSTTETGLLFLIAQGSDAVLTPFMGIGCDRLVLKRLSHYGKRKSWHLFGTIFVAIAWPFIMSPCFVCSSSSPSWLPMVYYSVAVIIFHVGWAAVQIAHLSLIPEIAKRPGEIVELNAVRSGLTFVCGIFIYVVTWVLLGQESEEGISPNLKREFTHLSIIVVGTGFFFSFLFHWGTVEPVSSTTDEDRVASEPSDAEQSYEQDSLCIETVERELVEQSPKTWRQWFKDPKFYAMGVVYTCTRITVNVSQSYFPFYLTDALHFQKEAIAYFPLVILVSGAFSSVMVKNISKRLGTKWTFCIASAVVICACAWFYVQTISARDAVYAAAFVMGSGNSVMLVTVLSMTADMIGLDKASGGFVYSFMGFLDKGFVGVVVLIIQTFYPDSPEGVTCEQCIMYVRLVFSLAPGISALIAMVIVAFVFKSHLVLSCRPRVETIHQCTQTEEDGTFDFYANVVYLPSTNV